jgi:hypothetical protein
MTYIINTGLNTIFVLTSRVANSAPNAGAGILNSTILFISQHVSPSSLSHLRLTPHHLSPYALLPPHLHLPRRLHLPPYRSELK